MTTLDHDIAVIGAGPTGLTLANLLGSAGCRVVLIERNETTVREPRAVSIDDESLRTMQAAGLDDAVIRDVALDYGSHYFTPGGTGFLKVEPTTREYGFPRRNAFTQPVLEATLREGLGRFPNVTTLFGWTCSAVTTDADGATLSLHTESGQERQLRVAYVAGCDGARSFLRKRIGATLTGSTYRQRWLIVDLAETRDQLRQTRVLCDPARPTISLPGPNGIRRYEFMLHEGEDETRAVEIDFVRGLLAECGPDAEARIVRRQVYTFHARIADRWRDGRIMIAGDAAHLTPPFAGQGMNSGIRDAHNLGWKLPAVVSGQLGPGLLDTYQAERAQHARSLIQLAVAMGRIMMPSSRLQAFLVQTGFRMTRWAPRIQSYFAEMKYKPKPFYGDGFTVRRPGGPDIVGRMFPQPLVEGRDRSRSMLDALLGSGFALVAIGPAAEQALAAARDLDLGTQVAIKIAILPHTRNPDADAPDDLLVVRDVGGLLARTLPGHQTLVLLLRPDRYVAAGCTFSKVGLEEFGHDCRGLVQASWTQTGSDSLPDQKPRRNATISEEER